MIYLLAFTLSVVAILLYSRFQSWSHRLATPPGPPRRWLVGNLFDIPRTNAWRVYSTWRRIYGDVIYLNLPGRSILVLGTFQTAHDLLHVRSHIYSTRIDSVMINMLSWDWAIASLPYGRKLRTYRRYFHEHFNISVLSQYHPIQLQQTRHMLTRILESPEQSRQHIRDLPGNVILRVVYGANTSSKISEYVQLAVTAMESARRIATPGVFMAEFIRLLRYVPGWLPGGSARKYAAKYKPLVQRMRDIPFDEVKRTVATGETVPSVAYNLIRQFGDECKLTSEQDELARNITGIAFAGGADTTIAAAEAFAVAMAMFPDVQKKAQEELDIVVGQNRLPDIQDLNSLTYIRAVTMEVVRWMPAVPLGIPHCVSTDDEYNGYRIPKNTVVIVNARAMLHDPSDYPDPDNFKPERFIGRDGKIDSAVRDPRNIAFGFGRRICPGSDFALSLVSIYIASMLHVFEIHAGVDDDGLSVVLTAEASDDAVITPMTFPRHFKPRSKETEHLVRDLMIPVL